MFQLIQQTFRVENQQCFAQISTCVIVFVSIPMHHAFLFSRPTLGPQSRVPLPNILPFAAYAHRRAARGSVPDYVRATAAAPEMAAFAGVGGSELLNVIETQFLREQQQQHQQGRHSNAAEPSGPDSVADLLALPSIRANAVLVLLNRTNGSGASVAFTAADQNVLQVRGMGRDGSRLVMRAFALSEFAYSLPS